MEKKKQYNIISCIIKLAQKNNLSKLSFQNITHKNLLTICLNNKWSIFRMIYDT